jgi:hypothetical protein
MVLTRMRDLPRCGLRLTHTATRSMLPPNGIGRTLLSQWAGRRIATMPYRGAIKVAALTEPRHRTHDHYPSRGRESHNAIEGPR